MLLQDQRPLAPHFNVDDAKCKFFLRSATALSNIEIWGAGYFSVVHGICSYELTMVGVVQLLRKAFAQLLAQPLDASTFEQPLDASTWWLSKQAEDQRA